MRNNSTTQKGKKKFNFTISKFRAQRYEDIWLTKVGKRWREKGGAHAISFLGSLLPGLEPWEWGWRTCRHGARRIWKLYSKRRPSLFQALRSWQARSQGGARGAVAPPPPPQDPKVRILILTKKKYISGFWSTLASLAPPHIKFWLLAWMGKTRKWGRGGKKEKVSSLFFFRVRDFSIPLVRLSRSLEQAKDNRPANSGDVKPLETIWIIFDETTYNDPAQKNRTS